MTDIEDPPKPQEEHLLHMIGRRQSMRPPPRRAFQGPARAIKLCLLCVILPGMLISIPLYLRYHVYYRQEYPLSMSDMRILNTRVSTTWCQSQLVRANTTFNAYVVNGAPIVISDPKQVSMSRNLVLEDDMKEYWAFYLLKGSTVTVSTCVRWQGASLIIIKGHKHLRECAYIGDDSSEEDEEIQEGLDEAAAANAQVQSSDEDDGNKTNIPQLMRRARPEVSLHRLQEPLTSKEKLKKDSADSSGEDDNVLARVLLRKATDRAKSKGKHVNEFVDTEERSKLKSNVPAPAVSKSPPTSNEVFEEVLQKIKRLGARGTSVLHKLNEQLGGEGNKELRTKIKLMLESNEESVYIEGTVAVTGVNQTAAPLQINQTQGSRQMNPPNHPGTDVNKTDVVGDAVASDDRVDDGVSSDAKDDKVTGAQVMKEVDDNKPSDSATKTVDDKMANSSSKETNGRQRREISFGGQNLEDLFNKDDDVDDTAIEEDLEPDGIADHHRTLNQTTAGDQSNSEFWSSFSSSEEALLKCSGLVLNLPLTPHRRCEKHRSKEDHMTASLANTISYKVPATGYYFFVFSSENEIQPNYFRVHFQLDKTMYNVTDSVASCQNTTDSCALPLSFWSYDTVILELPVGRNDSAWNEDFVVVSTCEPRTALYLMCVIAVPLVILTFALH